MAVLHINSGVQNHWFYLLTLGGSGTNDNSDAFAVNGIGITSASEIAFRNLTVYLTESSNYQDARFYSMISAIDLFGTCTPEVESTINAWYAVGVGGPYVASVVADFTAIDTAFCSPIAYADFTNLSLNANTFTWHFGDNNTSNALMPTHPYGAFGTYDVKLIADGGACGIDSLTIQNYIFVDTSVECVFNLTENGPDQLGGCSGTLYDSGGPNGDYGGLEDANVTIAPAGADSVKITFVNFDVEPSSNGATFCNYDYLRIYDGPTLNDPLIGTYCNNFPPPNTITSSGPELTIVFHSDVGLHLSGFEIDWECFYSPDPPVAAFESNDTITCSGAIEFTDLSINGPIFWTWDFGDGNSSTDQNPSHIYNNAGTYTVTLTVSNAVGANTATYTDFIIVDFVDTPIAVGDTICENQPATLSATSVGTTRWYDGPNAGNLLHTGDIFTTDPLIGSTSFYASNYEPGAPFDAGPISPAIGSGSYFNSYQYLSFDAYEACVLKSVVVDANGDGDRTIELRYGNGNVIDSQNCIYSGWLANC